MELGAAVLDQELEAAVLGQAELEAELLFWPATLPCSEFPGLMMTACFVECHFDRYLENLVSEAEQLRRGERSKEPRD